MVIVAVVVISLGGLLTAPAVGQAGRPSRATCEAAVRAGIEALTQWPRDQVEALIADWGGPETAAALGLPEGCRVPPSVPAIEPLENGAFALCLWWAPKTGDLGELLQQDGGWTAGWWECFGLPDD